MKKNLLKGMMSIAFAMLEMGANAQETVTVQPTADTWVRLNNKTNQAKAINMELQTYTNASDASKNVSMLGLMSFDVPNEVLTSGGTISKATLRLVTKRLKGDRKVNVYKYSDFEESTIYEKEADKIATAMVEGNLVASFDAQGTSNADLTSDDLKGNTTIEKWTNQIDLTDLVKSATDGKVDILLAKAKDQSNSTQIFTKEATDFTNKKDGVSKFVAADLVPQLTIVYEKSSTDGISEVQIDAANTSDAVYNLQGVRMNGKNLPAGIYIKNGKKFIVK